MSVANQFSTGAPGSGSAFDITIQEACAAGWTMVLTTCTLGDVTGVTDTKGNTWTEAIDIPITGATTRSAIWYCSISNALVEGDVVTVACSTTKFAGAITVFTDTTYGQLGTSSGDNGGASGTAVAVSSYTPSESGALLIANVGMLNVGRTITPTGSWTPGVKVQSTSGSGDRATYPFSQLLGSPAAVSSIGTFNSSGQAVNTLLALRTVEPAPAPGGAFYKWDGANLDPVTLLGKVSTSPGAVNPATYLLTT